MSIFSFMRARRGLVASGHLQDNSARFDLLFAKHADFAYRLVLRLGVNPADAKDAVLEVFMVVHRRLGEVRCGAEQAFVCGVAVRVASNCRRAERRRREDFRKEEPSGEAESCAIPGNAVDEAERVLHRTFGVQLLERSLSEMTESQRVVFILSELEQFSASEIGQALSLSLAAVVSRRRSARAAFQRFCERINPPEESQASLGAPQVVYGN